MPRDQFSGPVITEWLENEPRKMKVLEEIVFTDSKGIKWIAPTGSIVDGASIPRFFWRVIGSPFVGYYRRPTVLHDVYCENKSRTSDDVHAMFYEAMIADGVSKTKAKIMFNAVHDFGPKWGDNVINTMDEKNCFNNSNNNRDNCHYL